MLQLCCATQVVTHDRLINGFFNGFFSGQGPILDQTLIKNIFNNIPLLFIYISNLNKVLIKPLNSLKESLLLGKSLSVITEITAHSKAVLNVRVKVDLERLASLDENLLGAVSLLGGENAVGLRRCDGQGSLDGSEFIFLYERGVGDVADLDALLVVANNVLFLLAIGSLRGGMSDVPWRRSSIRHHRSCQDPDP